MTPEQAAYLTAPDTLGKWTPFTLRQRIYLCNKRFPEGPKISIYALLDLYRRHNVKPRAVTIKPYFSANKLASIEREKTERLPRLLGLL